MTEDGRYLVVGQIEDDHLVAIRDMLLRDLTPGYDQTAGRKMARNFEERRESLLDYTIDGTSMELDRDAYASAWLQIIDDDLSRRHKCPA